MLIPNGQNLVFYVLTYNSVSVVCLTIMKKEIKLDLGMKVCCPLENFLAFN